LRASDSVCQHFAEKLSLSRTTVNKLFAALDQLKRDTLAADDLAFHLGITTRSARRLLTTLTHQGLADVTGEELLSKGRPRKLYSIHWQKLLQPATGEISSEG
jgi:predicted ArsR family transcriptional regulator